jgi:hypothetical protein
MRCGRLFVGKFPLRYIILLAMHCAVVTHETAVPDADDRWSDCSTIKTVRIPASVLRDFLDHS